MVSIIMEFADSHPVWFTVAFLTACWLLCNILFFIDGVISVYTGKQSLYDSFLDQDGSVMYGLAFGICVVLVYFPGYVLYCKMLEKKTGAVDDGDCAR